MPIPQVLQESLSGPSVSSPNDIALHTTDKEISTYSHIPLEVYCSKGLHEESGQASGFYNADDPVPSHECFTNNCPYVSFTSCENTSCYIGRQSVIMRDSTRTS